MVQNKPKNCVVIDSKLFCESNPMTPKELSGVLIGIPAAIIFWGVMGFCVAKIVSKVFDITDMDNPLLMIAGLLVPPMIVGLIVLLLS